ncbi:hypothetical protein [Arthrobacter sp. efr-133-TYG-118]|uniref:hypothetical protein n=1 Tax=Arthrobacter sp. efr-133-TYG-118 TaxID=3040279 RepID=UPI002551AF97|nr:hypothetical protein [Arthrobacter sp. efr-133-TYG-118]
MLWGVRDLLCAGLRGPSLFAAQAGRSRFDAKENAVQIECYSPAMKAPRTREAAARVAVQAREACWTP